MPPCSSALSQFEEELGGREEEAGGGEGGGPISLWKTVRQREASNSAAAEGTYLEEWRTRKRRRKMQGGSRAQ